MNGPFKNDKSIIDYSRIEERRLQAEAEAEREQAEGLERQRRKEGLKSFKLKLAEFRGSRNNRPLARLAGIERNLDQQSRLRAITPKSNRAIPDPDLSVQQVARTVGTAAVAGSTLSRKMKEDAVRLFKALNSSDPIESILDRLLVGLSNGAMECLAQANSSRNERAIAVNMGCAVKAASAIATLVKLRDDRRTGPRTVTVQGLTVESGGQAIVGNVQTGGRNKDEAKE